MKIEYCSFCGNKLAGIYYIEKDHLYYNICNKCDIAFVVQERINYLGQKTIDISVESIGGSL